DSPRQLLDGAPRSKLRRSMPDVDGRRGRDGFADHPDELRGIGSDLPTHDLLPPSMGEPLVALAAANLAGTRLIDNLEI
ncbi:MAG: hypothetical protein ACRETL_10195, partial [Gammaproteobacteria bacterium]